MALNPTVLPVLQESLTRVLQEKIEAVTKLADLERSLTRSEDECGHMKDMCERLQEELQLLAEKYQDQLKAVQDVQIQLQVRTQRLILLVCFWLHGSG